MKLGRWSGGAVLVALCWSASCASSAATGTGQGGAIGGSMVAGAGGAPASGGASPSGGASGAGGGDAGSGGVGTGGTVDAATESGDATGGTGGTAMDSGTVDAGAMDARADASPAVDRAATIAVMRRVADAELAKFSAAGGAANDWVHAVFYTGLMALYRTTQDATYLAAAQSWSQRANWMLGPDNNGRPLPTPDNSRFADNQACVQTYAELYLQNPVPANQSVMLGAAAAAFDKMVAMPVAGRTEWWWCDALFMAPTAMIRTAAALNRPQYVAQVHTLYWDTKAYLFSPAQHLFFRDDSFFTANVFWSRGNGWVVGGLARILDALPAADARRPDYESLLREMAAKLLTIQGADGLWRSNLLDPNQFPNPESSGTAFFTFGMAWGINHGVLDRATYLAPVTRAWQGLVGVVTPQGHLGYVQPVGAQPAAAVATGTNDYADGAFLLAGAEMINL